MAIVVESYSIRHRVVRERKGRGREREREIGGETGQEKGCNISLHYTPLKKETQRSESTRVTRNTY